MKQVPCVPNGLRGPNDRKDQLIQIMPSAQVDPIEMNDRLEPIMPTGRHAPLELSVRRVLPEAMVQNVRNELPDQNGATHLTALTDQSALLGPNGVHGQSEV